MYNIHTQYKRTSFIAILLTIAITMLAVPAKRGIWQQLTLKDGTTVRAELRGDESFHYWLTDDGSYIADQGDGYAKVEDVDAWKARGQFQSAKARARRAARRQIHGFPSFTGKKRGLLILVEFSNSKFNSEHDIAFYEKVANKVGFTSKEGFSGSVHDYFLDQSNGLFDLTFDVVGPVKLKHDYSYYGQNDGDGYDMRPGEMIAEAVQAADQWVNYADYDWNGNGQVDMVMVIYAGKGEADGGDANTIWPHEWELSSSDYHKVKKLDGMTIDIYACANEISSNKSTGIGTICHEFSHCLGLPDMYDLYGNNYGMGSWSVMDNGTYSGDGYCPSGYTSFEKMSCGWLEPVVLTNDTIIDNLKPLSRGGEAYLLPNEGCQDEYYLIENRQQKGWDAFLPGRGLLILHVDYDENVWFQNEVNSTLKQKVLSGNDHQRCTIFHADNSTKKEANDLYPFGENNSLTAISSPAATLYNKNVDGTRNMGKSITAITQNNDGTISFVIGPQQFVKDGITTPHAPSRLPHSSAIYSLDGRYLGNDLQRLKSGLYIVGGKKFVK